jgi:hypothetical protein
MADADTFTPVPENEQAQLEAAVARAEAEAVELGQQLARREAAVRAPRDLEVARVRRLTREVERQKAVLEAEHAGLAAQVLAYQTSLARSGRRLLEGAPAELQTLVTWLFRLGVLSLYVMGSVLLWYSDHSTVGLLLRFAAVPVAWVVTWVIAVSLGE